MITRFIIQDNLWFHGKSQGGYIWTQTGRTMIPVEPLLGRTDSRNEEAKAQEYTWLGEHTTPSWWQWRRRPERHGENLVIAYQWQRPHDFTDRNLPGAIAVLKRTLPAAKRIIFYDPMLAVQQREMPARTIQSPVAHRFLLGGERGLASTPDYALAQHRDMLRSDLEHLSHHFRDPDYWHIDGRPVLCLWAWGYGCKNTHHARDILRPFYVLGDVFGGRDALMDAATGFTLQLPGRPAPRKLTTDQVLPEIVAQCRQWTDLGYPVVPAASLQYDDHMFMSALGRDPEREAIRLLARGRGDLSAVLETLTAHARPLADGRPAIFIGTANNWAEGTTILPTENRGADQRYPGGNIGHYYREHLLALKREVRRQAREES